MNNKLGIPSYLLLLMPLAIMTGPFLADLFASSIALIYLIKSLIKKNYHHYKNPIVIIILFFSIYLIIRSLFTENVLLSFESSLFYFRFIFFSVAIAYIVQENEKILALFAYSVLIVITFVVLDAYYQVLFGVNFFGISAYDFEGGLLITGNYYGQLTGIFGDEKILGSFIARMMPLAFAFLILLDNKFYSVYFIILIILADVVTFLSGERSAFFLLIFSFFLIVFLTKKWRKIRIFSFFISIIIIILISINFTSSTNRMVYKTLNQIGFIKDNKDTEIDQTNQIKIKDINNIKSNCDIKSESDNSECETSKNKRRIKLFSDHHENHYFAALNMFKENPIFGVGPKLFRIKCADPKYTPNKNLKVSDICSTHPHNTYIQLLSETGLIGFFFIFPLFLYICYLFAKQFLFLVFKRIYLINDFKVCLLVSLFIFTFPLIPTGSAFNNWLSVIHYMALGFYLGYNKKIND